MAQPTPPPTTQTRFTLGVGGLAQRTDEVLNVISFVQRAQGVGGKAHLLEDDGDGALFPVIPGDGQRDPLSCSSTRKMMN